MYISFNVVAPGIHVIWLNTLRSLCLIILTGSYGSGGGGGGGFGRSGGRGGGNRRY